MTKEELQQLYKEKILPENREPFNFHKDEDAGQVIEAYNPFCGDKFTLYLNEKEGRYTTVNFYGIGCAISKASTSILIKKINGRSVAEAKKLCHRFLRSIDEGKNFDGFQDQELEILASLKYFEGRMDCVKLSWKALADHLKNSKNED